MTDADRVSPAPATRGGPEDRREHRRKAERVRRNPRGWTVRLLLAVAFAAAACSSSKETVSTTQATSTTTPTGSTLLDDRAQSQVRAFEETRGHGLWAAAKPRASE